MKTFFKVKFSEPTALLEVEATHDDDDDDDNNDDEWLEIVHSPSASQCRKNITLNCLQA
jgi:hypothetical protein